MKSSRDGYRGRYQNRHNNFSKNRDNYVDQSTRGSARGHSSRGNGHYSPRTSLDETYNYRSSRSSINSRPISSRNGPPKHHRYQRDDDHSSSSSNRTNNFQINYYDNYSSPPPSRYNRSSSFTEQPMVSSISPQQSTSLHYSSLSQSIAPVRDRELQTLSSSQYTDSDRNRYGTSNYRQNSPLPLVSSYRNERTMDYRSRNINSDIYVRSEYRSLTPPQFISRPARGGDPYGETYRSNNHPSRSDRYEIPLNRRNSSSIYHRNETNRSSSNVSMPSPPSTYRTREHYTQDINNRPTSQSRDYGQTSSSSSYSNYSSPMDHDGSFYRNNRDNNYNDNRSSDRDRPNLKRSNSRYDNDGPTPSKRPMRR